MKNVRFRRSHGRAPGAGVSGAYADQCRRREPNHDDQYSFTLSPKIGQII
jgi:hypothetical protein